MEGGTTETTTTWTEERIQQLKEMWGQGISASEIGEKLSLSRNAVIGKAHRLGLSGRPSPIRKRAEEGGVSILELTERMCKWPIGDPRHSDFHFCGQPIRPGAPYCPEHAAIAFQPMAKKREEDRKLGAG